MIQIRQTLYFRQSVRLRVLLQGFVVAVTVGLCGDVGIGRALSDEAVDKSRNEPQQRRVVFSRDVYPILQRSCLECHGIAKQEGDLRLDRRESLAASGTVLPGEPDNSELLRRVSLSPAHEEIMPATGTPLTRAQVQTLRQWIVEGADWPDSFESPKHWSYLRPQRPEAPVHSNWSRSPIDDFICERLSPAGLEPSPAADPSSLLRRVYMDLIGLPPEPSEVDAFVDDPSEESYARVVDELLQRPQFGEHWARSWLDLARYADSHGFQRDDLRDVWAYRDWVIRAFNDDMPFDQFTIEQIAGDLLPDATMSQRIATGFHRCAPTNVEAGSIPEETRAEQLIDRVNTTASVWLGTTLECAQCHDHKYDPFSTTDYYRLLAFFNNTALEADRTNPSQPSSIAFQGPSIPLLDPVRDARRSEVMMKLQQFQEAEKQRRAVLAEGLEKWAVDAESRLRAAPVIHPLEITEFRSLGTTDSFRKLDEDAILLVGNDPPDKDQYTIVVSTSLADIRAFRLDALTHESLPGTGPGRGDPQRTNFVLNEFRVLIRNTGLANAQPQEAQPLKFASAAASFSQDKWDVFDAVDGRRETGWAIAPQFRRPHWALFTLDAPLDLSSGGELIVQLDQQFGNARTLGCFRLSAVTGNPSSSDPVTGVNGEVAEILQRAPAQWSAKDRARLTDYRAESDQHLQRLNRTSAALQKELEQLAPETTLVMIEEQVRPSYIFERGDYRKHGPQILPGTPSALHPLPAEPPTRLTLARWLVDPANPLAARVTVNRWWAEIFGQGLVSTPEDFGIKGDSPSHPELLDWLAVEFMEHGWSMKHVLRTMVLSSTYRQSSQVTPAQFEADDQNRLLARGPRFRLHAETIRDNALAIAGLLDLKPFGPPIRPPQPDGLWAKVGGTQYSYVVSPGSEQYRRGIYVVHKRSAPYPGFVNFDASARLACTVKRSRTNTPLQALTLLNDPVYVDAARALAARILREHPAPDPELRLSYGFQLCTSRKPLRSELAVLLQLVSDQSAEFQTRADDAKQIGGNVAGELQVPEYEAAAWCSVASVLLNLHETITRP